MVKEHLWVIAIYYSGICSVLKYLHALHCFLVDSCQRFESIEHVYSCGRAWERKLIIEFNEIKVRRTIVLSATMHDSGFFISPGNFWLNQSLDSIAPNY